MIDAGAMSSNNASLGGSFRGGLIVFEPVEKDLYLDFTGQGANYLIFRVAETMLSMKRIEQYSGCAYEVSYFSTNFHDRISWSLPLSGQWVVSEQGAQ